jgi:predicted MFS family arabinose efflux permease
LRFHGSDVGYLHDLPDSKWDKLLESTDSIHLTLALGVRCRDILPDRIRRRIDRNLSDNAVRLRRASQTYHDLAAEFDKRGVEFAVLKGIAQWPYYSDAPEHRPQYDIDVLCTREHLAAARDAAGAIEYEPLNGEGTRVDHLPAMVFKNGFRWRGDYFDPEMPLGLDIHFRLWDEEMEGFDAKGVDEFWFRRVTRQTAAGPVPALSLPDGLAYSALHFLRHLFRGDPRLYHGYEIAHFLERSASNEEFWREWRETHPAGMRRIEAIAFRFAEEWFGCRLSDEAADEVSALPAGMKDWFERFSFSPVRAITAPNKDDLFLHLQLIPERSKKIEVAARRALPLRAPKFQAAPNVPTAEVGVAERFSRAIGRARFLSARVATHARSLLPLALTGTRWWWTGKHVGAGVLTFLVAAALFNIGTAAFFLLYNLHLLRLGFREDLMGLVASAASAGSIAGTIPAGLFARRFGLRATLLIAFVLGPAMGMVRATTTTPVLLAGSAFAWGFVFAAYAVCLPPIITAMTSERSRPFAFSLVCACGIGSAALGGIVGGRLPALLRIPEASGLQFALLTACALSAFGAVAALWLKIPEQQPVAAPASIVRAAVPPFVLRFLAAAALWWMATGAFNPFFNAYLSTELKMSVGGIGNLFAWSQATQVLAILFAPAILRRFGLITGVSAMQIATAGAMLLLALRTSPSAVPVLFCGYMAFQYMSEPGLFTLLMSGVAPGQTSMASSLNMFVTFSVQAIAAALAGISVRQFGYAPVLLVAAAGAAAGGLAFRVFLRPADRPARELQEPGRNSGPPETAQPTPAAR